jgi:hypothetical protein
MKEQEMNLQDLFDTASIRKFQYASDESRNKLSKANKGSVKNDETRAKMSASKLGKKQSEEHRINSGLGHCKPIMTPLGQFDSLGHAAKAFNVCYDTMGNRLRSTKDKWTGYYYIKDAK